MTDDNSSEKPWGGRFTESTDAFVEAFTASIGFDHRLYLHDMAGSIAHARMLAHVGIITDDECTRIIGGLEDIQADIERGDPRKPSTVDQLSGHRRDQRSEGRQREVFGGDVEDVAVSTVNADLVLAGIAPSGSSGGTLYHSSDGGATWTPQDSGIRDRRHEREEEGREKTGRRLGRAWRLHRPIIRQLCTSRSTDISDPRRHPWFEPFSGSAVSAR